MSSEDDDLRSVDIGAAGRRAEVVCPLCADMH